MTKREALAELGWSDDMIAAFGVTFGDEDLSPQTPTPELIDVDVSALTLTVDEPATYGNATNLED